MKQIRKPNSRSITISQALVQQIKTFHHFPNNQSIQWLIKRKEYLNGFTYIQKQTSYKSRNLKEMEYTRANCMSTWY